MTGSSSPCPPAGRHARVLLVAATVAVLALSACGRGGGTAAREGAGSPYRQLELSRDIPDGDAGDQLRWFLDAVEELPIGSGELEEHVAGSMLEAVPPAVLNQVVEDAIDPDGFRFLGVVDGTEGGISAAVDPGDDRARRVLTLTVDGDGLIDTLVTTPYPLRGREARNLDPVALPEPTGPFEVGVDLLVAEDEAREGRQIPFQLWYPAAEGGDGAPARYALPATAAFVAEQLAVPERDIDAIRTHARSRSAVAGGERFPVVLFSPGYGVVRTFYSGYALELASQGYVVAVVDHPGDGELVELPDGATVAADAPAWGTDPSAWLGPRVADVRRVLDELAGLDAGAGGRFAGRLDTDRVAAGGHSLGGATGAAGMLTDPRLDAGFDLDGTLFGEVVGAGLDRPFLLMGSRSDEESWTAFRSRTEVAPLVVLDEAGHLSFSDWPSLAAFRPPSEEAEDAFDIGGIPAARAAEIQHGYLLAFLDQHLRQGDGTLLDRESERFPEARLP